MNVLPECASDRSKTFMPLSTANTMICSACSSVTFGLNVGHVPGNIYEKCIGFALTLYSHRQYSIARSFYAHTYTLPPQSLEAI